MSEEVIPPLKLEISPTGTLGSTFSEILRYLLVRMCRLRRVRKMFLVIRVAWEG
jgi:hypothetical protein